MALTVDKVVKHFGDKTAVNGLSFSLDKPGVFGLLGTNGAGKTTTIRMILGILEKDAGTIEWNGRPVTRESVSFGYLPEERGLYPRSKVTEQLMYFAKLRGMEPAAAHKSIKYWLERLDAVKYADMTADRLSKGNQQKIQLIAAVLHNPDLIVLDEPLSGLDPVNADMFKEVILEFVKNCKYVVMSSHQMEQVEEYCQDILLLKDGETILKGNLREIKHSYGRTNLYIGCENTDSAASLAAENGLSLIDKNALGCELRISSEEQAYAFMRALLDAHFAFERFEIREPSLHEIFIEKVGEQQ